VQAHIKLGRLFGITIGLHISWFVIAALIVLSLAGHFAEINPLWSGPTVWVSALVTGLLFFASLLIHEMAHALVARARRLPVRSITLFALGGVANMDRDAGDAPTEFWMGIAGPIMSAVIGGVCLGVVRLLGGFDATNEVTPPSAPLAVFTWLGYINLALAAFNMLPGFPLDGGRVLRAAIWWMKGDKWMATRIAARSGQVLALLFIVFGLAEFFSGLGFGGLWLALIGWFLFNAATASLFQMEVFNSLQGLRVRDVMTQDCERIRSDLSLQEVAEDHVLRTGQRCFLVQDNGRIAGLVTPGDLKKVDRGLWPLTPVSAVMRPFEHLQTIAPEAPLAEALERMGREDVNQLPVMADGHLEGMLTRGQIVRNLESRAELSM
jgi:Zn-dependent protease